MLQADIVIPQLVWPILATLTGALIGAIVPYYLRNKRRKRKLRIALITEIRSMKGDIEDWGHVVYSEDPDLAGAPIPGANPFKSTVYNANAGDIGFLNQSEAKKVGELYSMIVWYDSIINRFLDNNDLPAHVTHVMLRRIPLLLNRINLALNELENNLPEEDVSEVEYVEFDPEDDVDNIVSRFNLDEYETISFSRDWELVKDDQS